MSITPLPQALIKPYEPLNTNNCEINKDEADVESHVAESSSLKSRKIEVIEPKQFTQSDNESTPLIKSNSPVLQKKPIKKEKKFWDFTQEFLTVSILTCITSAQVYQNRCYYSSDSSNCDNADYYHTVAGLLGLIWIFRAIDYSNTKKD